MLEAGVGIEPPWTACRPLRFFTNQWDPCGCHPVWCPCFPRAPAGCTNEVKPPRPKRNRIQTRSYIGRVSITQANRGCTLSTATCPKMWWTFAENFRARVRMSVR